MRNPGTLNSTALLLPTFPSTFILVVRESSRVFKPGATGWFTDNHSFLFMPKASRFNLVFTSFSSSGSYILSSGFSLPEMSREQYVGRGNESLVSLSMNNSNVNTSLFRFFSRRRCPLSRGDFCSYKGLPLNLKFLKLGDLPFEKAWLHSLPDGGFESFARVCALGKCPQPWTKRKTREKPDRLSARNERSTRRLQNDLASKGGFRDVSSTFLVLWESLMLSSVVHRGPRHRETLKDACSSNRLSISWLPFNFLTFSVFICKGKVVIPTG